MDNIKKMKFTANDFQDFARKVNCMSEIEFKKMYDYSFETDVFPSYVKEKLYICRSSFLNWMCCIEDNFLEKMIEYCLKKED